MAVAKRALGVGWPLHSDAAYLRLTREIIEQDADYFVVAPETLWTREGGRLVPNEFHALALDIRRRSGRPFVAHGLGFSVGTPLSDGSGRTRAWLDRLREDHAAFGFEWMTEHLGWTVAAGIEAALPLPLPLVEESVVAVAERMRALAEVVPAVGFENNATYFALGDASREPEFFNAICRTAPCGMLLDLHNVHTQCVNFGLDAEDYVDRIELEAVFEVHLSGGSVSDAAWLPSRRTFRLDTHDGPVPEEVWRLLERVRPRCPNLRGIVVERMNGTLAEGDVPALRDEVRRAKEHIRC